MTQTRKWSLLAAVLVVAIFAAGWFLLIAPKRSEAAGLRADAQTAADANARLVQQLEVLKAQQADLPAQRARLATFKTQIPENPALPALIRDLTAAGRKIGVAIDAMSPQPPVALVTAAPAAPVAAPSTDATATDATATDATATDGTAVAPAVPAAPQLFQVPLALDVTGSYFELEQFTNKLEKLKRSFRLTGFTLAPASGEDVAATDLTLKLQGRVFLAPPAAAAAAPSTPVAPAPAGQ